MAQDTQYEKQPAGEYVVLTDAPFTLTSKKDGVVDYTLHNPGEKVSLSAEQATRLVGVGAFGKEDTRSGVVAVEAPAQSEPPKGDADAGGRRVVPAGAPSEGAVVEVSPDELSGAALNDALSEAGVSDTSGNTDTKRKRLAAARLEKAANAG